MIAWPAELRMLYLFLFLSIQNSDAFSHVFSKFSHYDTLHCCCHFVFLWRVVSGFSYIRTMDYVVLLLILCKFSQNLRVCQVERSHSGSFGPSFSSVRVILELIAQEFIHSCISPQATHGQLVPVLSEVLPHVHVKLHGHEFLPIFSFLLLDTTKNSLTPS